MSASRPWLRHPAPVFCRPRHGSAAPGPQRQKTGARRLTPPFRLRRNRACGHRPHRGRCFGLPRFRFAQAWPLGQQPGACRRSAPFRCAKPRVRLPAPPGPVFCRPRHGSAAPGPQRQKTGARRLTPPFRLRRNRACGYRPHLLGLPRKIRRGISLRETTLCGCPLRSHDFVTPHRCFSLPRFRSAQSQPHGPSQHPGACRRSAPFRCAKPRWPVVAPAGGNVLATPFSLRSNVAPRSHPGAQLRFILKQLYASGCPFLRNFPFFSSVPHPFFASAPGRTDTQKSAAGIPRRGFNTFSVSWLYFPLPNT